MSQASVKDKLLQPSFALACIGLACCFAVCDSNRFLISQDEQSSVIAAVLSLGRIVPLIPLFFLYKRKKKQSSASLFAGHPVRLTAIAVLEAVGIGLTYFPHPSLTSIAFESLLIGVGNSLLLIAWAEVFLVQSPRNSLLGLAFALLLGGSLELLLAMLNPFWSATLTMLLPAISCVLLQRSFVHFYKIDESSKGDTRSLKQEVISLLISVCGYTFVFNSLHVVWMAGGSAETLPLLRISAAIGTALSSLFVYLAYDLSHSNKLSHSFSMLLIPIVMSSLYLSTFLTSGWSAAYVAPLYVARKMVLYLIWSAALLYTKPSNRMRVFILGLASLEIGSLVYALFSRGVEFGGLDDTPLITVVVFAVLLLLAGKEFIGWIREQKAPPSSENKGIVKQRAFDTLQKEFTLTKREREFLPFLAIGRNADYIAKSLFIAPATAKSHIAHIYKKMDIGSQQQFMDIVEEKLEAEHELLKSESLG